MSKNLRINRTIKKYNVVYSLLINNDALIQVELGLSIVEMYVINILKVKKIPILKFQSTCIHVI